MVQAPRVVCVALVARLDSLRPLDSTVRTGLFRGDSPEEASRAREVWCARRARQRAAAGGGAFAAMSCSRSQGLLVNSTDRSFGSTFRALLSLCKTPVLAQRPQTAAAGHTSILVVGALFSWNFGSNHPHPQAQL